MTDKTTPGACRLPGSQYRVRAAIGPKRRGSLPLPGRHPIFEGMEELQIPTRTVAVDIVTDAGQTIDGILFLAETRHTTGRPEDVVDVLNDERGFIPFRLGSGPKRGRDVVLNKDHIVRVRLRDQTGSRPSAARGSPAGPSPGAPPAAATEPTVIHLSDGSRVAGRILVDTPRAASRLLDKLNLEHRFIPLIRDDGGTEFVHRAHVVRLD